MYVFGRLSSYFDLFPSKSYVLDHSESIDKFISKMYLKKKLIFCQCLQKNRVLPYGRGGGQTVTDMSATIRFFLRLPFKAFTLNLLFFTQVNLQTPPRPRFKKLCIVSKIPVPVIWEWKINIENICKKSSIDSITLY